MRGTALGGIASATIVAACSLGVVDLPPDPSPAELFVVSEIAADPADPSRVQVVVRATLDPGIAPDGAPRELASDIFRVEDTAHSPSDAGDASRPTWLATQSYQAPGPEAVRLGLPMLEGFGPAETINMRVRVAVTPGSTILLAEGEDLVMGAEPPSNPAQALEWSLELTSSSTPAFGLQVGGDEWPVEVRVPASRIPASALPLEATLRIRWDRSLDLFALTRQERYELDLRSIMVVTWAVERAT